MYIRSQSRMLCVCAYACMRAFVPCACVRACVRACVCRMHMGEFLTECANLAVCM